MTPDILLIQHTIQGRDVGIASRTANSMPWTIKSIHSPSWDRVLSLSEWYCGFRTVPLTDSTRLADGYDVQRLLPVLRCNRLKKVLALAASEIARVARHFSVAMVAWITWKNDDSVQARPRKL